MEEKSWLEQRTNSKSSRWQNKLRIQLSNWFAFFLVHLLILLLLLPSLFSCPALHPSESSLQRTKLQVRIFPLLGLKKRVREKQQPEWQVWNVEMTANKIALLLLTILLFISWKWISQTLSTTSSDWNVTKPKPRTKRDRRKMWVRVEHNVNLNYLLKECFFLCYPSSPYAHKTASGREIKNWGW